MTGSSVNEILFVSVNQSITLMGKLWLIVMLFLRVLVLLLAGFPLYQDEQERFVCNTIQPGCANVCYDLFSPISLFRFWLVQLLALCLPYVLFVTYVLHKVAHSLRERRPRCFTVAYVLQLLTRTLLEAAFGAAHYYLFGFRVPRRFLCHHPPCTTQADCYISRPTEKTVLLNFLLAAAALCFLLDLLDFGCAVRRALGQRRRGKREKEEEEEEEKKQKGGVGVNKGRHPHQEQAEADGCSVGEDALERNGSEVALCPQEPTGTPRAIRVSKRSRTKPPPPPRWDPGSAGGAPAAPNTRRAGQYGLVELDGTGAGEEPEKKSEWV